MSFLGTSFSSPSGMSDLPDPRSSSMSERRSVSSFRCWPRRMIVGRRLGGEQAGHGPAVLEPGLVLDVPRVEVAVRVEDFLHQVRRRAVGEGRQVRADVDADVAELVARGTHAGEDGLAAVLVAVGGHVGVVRDDLGPVRAGGPVEHLGGPVADRLVRVVEKPLPAGGVDLAGGDGLRLDGGQQRRPGRPCGRAGGRAFASAWPAGGPSSLPGRGRSADGS